MDENPKLSPFFSLKIQARLVEAFLPFPLSLSRPSLSIFPLLFDCYFCRLQFTQLKVGIPILAVCGIFLLPSIKKILQVLSLHRWFTLKDKEFLYDCGLFVFHTLAFSVISLFSFTCTIFLIFRHAFGSYLSLDFPCLWRQYLKQFVNFEVVPTSIRVV